MNCFECLVPAFRRYGKPMYSSSPVKIFRFFYGPPGSNLLQKPHLKKATKNEVGSIAKP